MTTNLKFIISYIALFICFFEINAQDYPNLIRLNGDKLHIQGIAFDHKKNCIYSSFTSAFYKSDINGKIIGSVAGINGHLGAITFDAKSRKVYASLEFKNDDIGKNISKIGDLNFSLSINFIKPPKKLLGSPPFSHCTIICPIFQQFFEKYCK